MSSAQEQGMAALLADALAADRPDPELLVRYARDPGSLDAVEREDIEHHLAHTPGCAAQLSILRRLLESQRAGAAGPVQGQIATQSSAGPQRLRSAPRRRSRAWAIPAGLAAAAAALVLGIHLAGTERPASAPANPTLARTEPSPNTPERNPGTAVPSDSPKPGVTSPDGSETAGTPPRAPERIQLAALALPQYRQPTGAGDRPRLGSATRGLASGTRVEALAPAHVGRTVSASPGLAWYLSAVPMAGSKLQFTLTTERVTDVVETRELSLPATSGVQRIALADFGVKLAPGTRYRWSVLLREPEPHDREFALAQGFVERIEPEAALQQQIAAAAPEDLAALYAGAGLWYDALDVVLDRRAVRPQDPSASEALAALLRSADLSSLSGAIVE